MMWFDLRIISGTGWAQIVGLREWGGVKSIGAPLFLTYRRKHGRFNLFSWLSMKERGRATRAWVCSDPLTPAPSPCSGFPICPSSFRPALQLSLYLLIQKPPVVTLHCSSTSLCSFVIISHTFDCLSPDLQFVSVFVFFVSGFNRLSCANKKGFRKDGNHILSLGPGCLKHCWKDKQIHRDLHVQTIRFCPPNRPFQLCDYLLHESYQPGWKVFLPKVSIKPKNISPNSLLYKIYLAANYLNNRFHTDIVQMLLSKVPNKWKTITYPQ